MNSPRAAKTIARDCQDIHFAGILKLQSHLYLSLPVVMGFSIKDSLGCLSNYLESRLDTLTYSTTLEIMY